jgi:hypothetical protein
MEKAREELKRQHREADEINEQFSRAVKYDMATEQEKLHLEACEKYNVLVNRVNPEKPE